MIDPAPDALVTDTSSPTQNARARRKVKDRAADERAVLRKVLGTYEGRQLVWLWISRAGVFEDLVGTNEAVREQIGRRRLGLQLLAEAGAHRELFAQMQAEAVARAEHDRKETQATRLADQAEAAAQS